MRVGYLVSEFPKVSETFILDELKQHLANGVDVTVISLRCERQGSLARRNSAGLNIPVEYVFAKRRLGYLLEQIRLSSLALITKPALWRVAFGRESGRLIERLTLLALAYRLRDIERTSRFDVLHCHFGRQGRYAAILRRAQVLQAKIVTTFHGFDISSTVAQRGRRHYDVLFDQGDLFLPISDYWARNLRDLGCNPHRIIVHHMGVACDPDASDSQSRASETRSSHGQRHNPHPMRLISIGRCVEKKGHRYSLQALALLGRRRPDIKVTLDIIGDGPWRETLMAESSSLGLDGIVTFHGARSHADTLAMLDSASIFLLPSITSDSGDMEGIPVSLMEAMARHMPVISTYHSGIPELVDDGISGLLVPERDSVALAAAIEQMVDQPHQWRQFGAAGRRKVAAEFDQKSLGRRLRELYQTLISQHRLSVAE